MAKPVTLDLSATLKETFDYDRFREGQKELIQAVLEGRDAMGIVPTGAGKSLTYQLPAKILKGFILVISPLLSLMFDQIDEAQKWNLKAYALNSQMTMFKRDSIFDEIVADRVDLLFLAPESLGGMLRILKGLHRHLEMIVYDEAHCIHDQGKTYRPAYRELNVLSQHFHVPRLLLTATANATVQADILSVLGIRDVCLHKLSSFRRNLYLAPIMTDFPHIGRAIRVN
jgi:ATP-dependent DNA helicase RecQ